MAKKNISPSPPKLAPLIIEDSDSDISAITFPDSQDGFSKRIPVRGAEANHQYGIREKWIVPAAFPGFLAPSDIRNYVAMPCSPGNPPKFFSNPDNKNSGLPARHDSGPGSVIPGLKADPTSALPRSGAALCGFKDGEALKVKPGPGLGEQDGYPLALDPSRLFFFAEGGSALLGAEEYDDGPS